LAGSHLNLIVGWCGRFSLVVGEWPENQILIPDWTYFYCPGATLIYDVTKVFISLKKERIIKQNLTASGVTC